MGVETSVIKSEGKSLSDKSVLQKVRGKNLIAI